MTKIELTQRLEEIQAECDRLQAEKTKKEAEKLAVEHELISVMQDEGIDSFRNPEIGRSFSIKTDIIVKKVDEDAVFAWLKESGNGDAIKETIHASTFKAIARDYLGKTGMNVPGTEITTFQRIGSRKATIGLAS